LSSGIKRENIWALNRCTTEDDFFSYRRDNGKPQNVGVYSALIYIDFTIPDTDHRSLKIAKATLAIPLVVKKARFTFERSSGLTSEC
jgi:hypothetical protein